MRKIHSDLITEAIKKLSQEANLNLPQDVKDALQNAKKNETSETGKNILEQLQQNAEVAEKEKMPICQDTGMAVVFVELGQEVLIEGETIQKAVNEGIKQGYEEGYLRKSVVKDPVNRKNTQDNTPAIIHIEQVHGDRLTIKFAPKGGGAENMSRLAMLKPAQGVKGIKKFVLETIEQAGANPCPPIIIGLGLGGNFEKSAILAKRALFRDLNQKNPDVFYANLEEELENEINNLGIGPQGFGGTQTCLRVLIETYPCHIASLPIAVNIQCHAARHKEIVI